MVVIKLRVDYIMDNSKGGDKKCKIKKTQWTI